MTKAPGDRPCTKICHYDDDTGWCLGCGMTKAEKKAWKRIPAYRDAIRLALPARLAALAAEGHPTGEAARAKRRKE
ncbi:DUF1289 domain-containing protein [Roseomonas xinghualingensis]|uniref:DUF1289 domain-containing protein n=1 Tax=Roseomonas xinghualingensis TaxID=2986475 RepID=UPI00298ED0A5|nr:DUF1289 domain-containing protein [Roseomonas sp. SXEYE001]